MFVLPADCTINFERMDTALGCGNCGLAREGEVRALFPESEVGDNAAFWGTIRYGGVPGCESL